MMLLTHHQRFIVHSDGVFNDVNSYEELNLALRTYGHSKGIQGSQEYNDATGAALEIFCEYFYRRYETNPKIGVSYIEDTSADKFQTGYDFRFLSFAGKQGRIQTKFRGNTEHKFTRDELGTFVSILYEEEIQPQNAILFTNLLDVPSEQNGSVFHFSYENGARKSLRVHDQRYQQDFILVDPDFWKDLRVWLDASCHTDFTCPFDNRIHQQQMFDNQLHLLTEGGRGSQICATGGGKSLVQYKTFDYLHNVLNKKLTILVAPTLDLGNQHFNQYYSYGFYHKGITAINFKTGDEPDYDDHIQFLQTTEQAPVVSHLTELFADVGKHIHVITTYASVEKFTNILDQLGIVADCIIFDEYQNLISQKVNEYGISNMGTYLAQLPCFTILYYSASIKRGRVLSALNENIFGPILTNITYKYLREQAILVPKVIVKVIRISDGERIAGLTSNVQHYAKMYENLDIKAATIEAAGVVVAFEDAQTFGDVNMVTFSERVNHCRIIGDSEVVKARLSDTNLHVVHAGVPSVKRTKIYDSLKKTTGNILLQHSCVTEGIDVTSFNAAVVIRSLGVIETQQGPIGRTVRAHPDDTKNFEAGLITLDNPEGWKKYSSTVYIIVDNEKMDVYRDYIKDIIKKLQSAGLTLDDYQMMELFQDRGPGGNDDENGDVIPETKSTIDELSLEDVIRRAQLELEEEERKASFRDLDDEDDLLNFIFGT